MTRTTWTTSANVPLAPWAALSTDLQTLLGVMRAGGATVTNPAGNTGPVFTDTQLAFTVTLPSRAPLTVMFERQAGTGSVETSSPMTSGLVLVALERTLRHSGLLLTITSDAGTEARALCSTVVEGLFGASDRAVTGGAAPSVRDRVNQAIAEALDSVARAEQIAVDAAVQAWRDQVEPAPVEPEPVVVEPVEPAPVEPAPEEPIVVGNAGTLTLTLAEVEAAARYDLVTYLGEMLVELDAHRDGVAAAAALLSAPR